MPANERHNRPGSASLLLIILLIAGGGTLLFRQGPGLVQQLIGGQINAPSCSAVLNRWASQRVTAARARIEADHTLYRADGRELNTISAAFNWIDDRIIDQRMSEERRRLSAAVLKSAHCTLRFRD